MTCILPLHTSRTKKTPSFRVHAYACLYILNACIYINILYLQLCLSRMTQTVPLLHCWSQCTWRPSHYQWHILHQQWLRKLPDQVEGLGWHLWGSVYGINSRQKHIAPCKVKWTLISNMYHLVVKTLKNAYVHWICPKDSIEAYNTSLITLLTFDTLVLSSSLLCS